jgi:hypothetical protein
MLEQQVGIQPKPQPSHENPEMRGRMSTGTPPTEFEFSPLSLAISVTLVTERPAEKGASRLEQQAGIQAKTAAEPRKSSNVGPYVDGDTSNRVRVFAAVDLTPRDTRHQKAGRKGQHDASATGGNPIQKRSRATKIPQCGAVCRRGHLQQSSSFRH